MRCLLIWIAGLVLALFCVVECRKHKFHDTDLISYKVANKPLTNTFHKGSKHGNGHHGGKLLHLKEGGHMKSLHDGWMDVPKDSECKNTKCGHKEVCLRNPKTEEEKCVNKRQFREGRRLFKEFHRERMFLEQDMMFNKHNKFSKHNKKGRSSKKGLMAADHMKDVYELLHDYKKHSHKDIDVKSLMKGGSLDQISEVETGSPQECRPQELYELRKRLIGWFVLLHTESRQRFHRQHKRKFGRKGKHGKKHWMGRSDKFGKSPLDMKKDDLKLESKRTKRAVHEGQVILTESHHQCKCAKSAMWEFRKKDLNRDSQLNHEELADIEHLKREPCLKPFLKSCDLNGDGSLSHGEWCCCMTDTIPPCAEKKRLSDPDGWVPSCDKEGYFQREQCEKNSGYCWCVDINGNQIPDTKKQGSAHCGRFDPNGQLIKE